MVKVVEEKGTQSVTESIREGCRDGVVKANLEPDSEEFDVSRCQRSNQGRRLTANS